MKLKPYVWNILIGFDQLVNTLLGGAPDETLSSRAWRLKDASRFWGLARRFIDALFFLQEEHCKQAYLAEVNRTQIDLTIPVGKEK